MASPQRLLSDSKVGLRFRVCLGSSVIFCKITVSVWCELRLVSVYRGRRNKLGRGRNPQVCACERQVGWMTTDVHAWDV